MAITYPRTWPGFGIRLSSFGLNRLQSAFEADATRQVQVQNFNAGLSDRWEGIWTVRKLIQVDVANLSAWLTSLNGRLGTFFAYDPDRRIPNGSISIGQGSITCDNNIITCDSDLISSDNGNGIITVNGNGQTGKSLNVNMDAVANALLPGDYVQVGTGFHIMLEVTNGGATTLEFDPVMRSSPTDGQEVIFINPVLIARLVTQFKQWDTDQSKIGDFSFAFEEVLQ
jgi:hypothetical protein